MAIIKFVNKGGYDVKLTRQINYFIADPTKEYTLDTSTVQTGDSEKFFFTNTDPYNTSDDTVYKMGGNFRAWFYTTMNSQVMLSGNTPDEKSYNGNNFYAIQSKKTGNYVRDNIATNGAHAYTIYYQTDYTPPTASHNITKTLTNCTGEIPDTIDDGTSFSWTITPNSGYEFKEGSVTSNVGTVSITSTGATITGTATTDITIQATATAIPVIVTHTVTKTLTNCTGEIPSTINDGEQFTWTLTPNEGYEFKEGSVTSTVGTVSITSTGATVTGTATENITITANATKKEAPKETVNIKAGTLENCTYTPNSATYGDTVTVTITADENYAFTTATPYIEYVGPLSQIENHKFTLNSDKTIGTYSLDTTQIKKLNDAYNVTVYGTPTYQQGTTVSEMYTIYKVSNEDLQKVSNKRFLNVAGNDSAYYEPLINYINSLYRLPLVFNDLPSQALILKNITVVNKSSVIPNTKYEYTLGEVTLPKHFNTSNDYNNIYYLTLPYYGVYTLDNTKCLNSVLTIKATIDIISGDCVYTIIRDGTPIDSIRCNIKENLPYMTRDKEVLSNNITVNMFELPPKIACYYHAITNSFVSNDENETIENLNYFRADKIIKSNNIPKKYIELIENELRKGVYVNEL